MAGLRVHFVFPAVLVERVDAARGGVSRGEFVRRAVERALSGEPPGATPSAERDPVVPAASVAARSAAPAEQPCIAMEADREMFRRPVRDMLPGARSSSQAKRDVAPVPKRGEKK